MLRSLGLSLTPPPRKTGGPGGPLIFRRADAGRLGNNLAPPTLLDFSRCNFLATSPECTNVTEVRSYRGGTSLPPAGRKGRESNNAPRLFFRRVRQVAKIEHRTVAIW